MTSFAMALGSLPLALSLGAASASRQPLGIVIVAGVMFSLVLTLFVIPAMYTYLSRRRDPVKFNETPEHEVPQNELVYEG
jgi:multidrug efflux pump